MGWGEGCSFNPYILFKYRASLLLDDMYEELFSVAIHTSNCPSLFTTPPPPPPYPRQRPTLNTFPKGDIRPQNDGERLVAFGGVIVGAGFYGLAIGAIAAIVGNVDSAKQYVRVKHQERDEKRLEAAERWERWCERM